MKKLSNLRTILLSVFTIATLFSLSSCDIIDIYDEPIPLAHRKLSTRGEAEIAFPDAPRGTIDLGEYSFAVVEGHVVSGDIVLSEEQTDILAAPRTRGAANVSLVKNWPDGVIPYTIAAGFTGSEKVLAAIEHWEANTPFRFVPKSSTTRDYVEFFNGSGNWSYVGRIGGKQQLSLSLAANAGTAMHEIGHLVGLLHEHSRLDRDGYLTILEENVADGYVDDFDFYTLDGYNGEDVGEFDFGSIMLYGSYSFSGNGQPTIVRKSDGTTFTGQRRGLSAGDMVAAQRIFERSTSSAPAAPAPEQPVVNGGKNKGKNKNDATTSVPAKGNNGKGNGKKK